MKSLLTRMFITFSASAAALVGYGMWYAVVVYTSADLANLQNQVVAETETASRIASARAALSGIAGDENAVQNYFVPETGVVAFINDLETHGRAQGAIVDVLSVSTDTKSVRPTLLLTLSIKGTFDAILRTVGTIEYAPYALIISDLSVRQDTKNAWHADLKILVGSIKAKTP